MRVPSGEQLTLLTTSACPVNANGGAGHDNRVPACILIALVNSLLKILDKGDCGGRNGPAEI
jgi:hypothetical protein